MNNWYDNIKDPSWPETIDAEEIKKLPANISQEIITRILLPLLDSKSDITDLEIIRLPYSDTCNRDYKNVNYNPQCRKTFKINDVTVYYDDELDGGGTNFGHDFTPVIKLLYPNKTFNNCLEWCAGPGFIGFGLLANDICKNLYLAEIFKPAIQCCNKTIACLPLRFADRLIETIHLSSVSEIAPDKMFDLVVASPPFFNRSDKIYGARVLSVNNSLPSHRLTTDTNWNIHRDFYKNVKKHLSKDGIILLQEEMWHSGPDTFHDMIHESGLEITDCFHTSIRRDIYYLEVRHLQDKI